MNLYELSVVIVDCQSRNEQSMSFGCSLFASNDNAPSLHSCYSP